MIGGNLGAAVHMLKVMNQQGGGQSWESELVTYMAGLTTELSSAQLVKINDFIKDYKADDSLTNLSDAYDVMYYLGNETAESSLRNMVKRAHDATAVNSPTFTPYEGWQGDGISSYIDTNYNPSTQADNYALDDCAFGVYCRTARAADDNKYHGVVLGSNYTQIMLHRATSNSVRGWVNTAVSAGTVDHTVSNTLGMSIIGRSAANSCYASRNKSISSGTGVSNGIPNDYIYLLARNAGGARGFDNVQISFAFAGKYLDSTSVGYLTDDFEALMDANGKGVIA